MQSFSFRVRTLLPIATLCLLSIQGCGGGSTDSEGAGTATILGVQTTVAKTDQATLSAKTSDLDKRSALTPLTTTTLTIRAHAELAANVGPIMEVRVDGIVLKRVEVRATTPTDYVVNAPMLAPGSKVDIALVNFENVNGEARNLFIGYVTDGYSLLSPDQLGAIFGSISGSAAFESPNVMPGQQGMYFNVALRFTWPTKPALDPALADASRFLQQAAFGGNKRDISQVAAIGIPAWIDAQMAVTPRNDFVDHVQAQYNRGPDFQPLGSRYDADWVAQRFWMGVAGDTDQLRRRVAYSLHKILVVSQADPNLYWQTRAVAAYVDVLQRYAFGNFRDLIEEVALSPAMGIYLSHMRNQKEDAISLRQPDENFARELMQLFTIGLHELNRDGTPRLGADGQPLESYGNADVMALAKVFTGWSWGYDDAERTESVFRWGIPLSATTGAARIDIRRMRAYPGQHSTAEKRLFAGKPQALAIPAGTPPEQGLKMALDALFRHPNVGPFIGRQLIQHLVTSNPSPAYVARVTAVFDDDGRGTRGNLGATVRAILLDPEARGEPGPHAGRVREPVLRIAQWIRTFDARSASGQFQLTYATPGTGQKLNHMPSVFGYYRPGFAPAGSLLAEAGLVAPELQIVDESTTAQWINTAYWMIQQGLGWHGNMVDVTAAMTAEIADVGVAPQSIIDHLDLVLFAGRMSPALRKACMDAMAGVPSYHDRRSSERTRVAVWIALSAPEYLVQR